MLALMADKHSKPASEPRPSALCAWAGAAQGSVAAGQQNALVHPVDLGVAAKSHGQVQFLVDDLQGLGDAGFAHGKAIKTPLERTEWWKTDMLPEPLRHASGHEGSHTFITHEFVDAMNHGRRPVVDIREALAYTVPGIVAHQSALKGGESLKIPQIG